MSSSDIVKDKTKQWWIIGSVCFAAFIGTLDNYIVNISLPSISKFFNVSTSEVANVTLIYLLIMTSSIIIFGKIVDRIGVKKVFVGGFIVFTLGSFFCGVSPSLNLLIASRVLQAIGGSMLYASAFAIIPKFLPANITGFSFGIISTASALGITLGAPLGGIITGLYSWHWIFLVNVPVGIIAIIVSILVIPADNSVQNNSEQDQKFDVTGAVMIFTCLMLLVYGLNNAHTLGWTSVPVILCLLFSAITFISFIFWEKINPCALVDLTLFKKLDFTFSNMASLMGFLVLSGSNFLIPFYLILLQGFSEKKAGIIVLVYSLVYIIVSPLMGRLSDKIQPRFLCALGMFVGALACLLFAFTLNEQGIIPVILFLMLLGLSYGLFISPNNNLIMSIAPQEKIGVSTSIFKTLTNLSLILGVIVFETTFTMFLPETAMNESSSLLTTHINSSFLVQGFSEAFIVGTLVCIVAAICCILVKDQKQPVESLSH